MFDTTEKPWDLVFFTDVSHFGCREQDVIFYQAKVQSPVNCQAEVKLGLFFFIVADLFKDYLVLALPRDDFP